MTAPATKEGLIEQISEIPLAVPMVAREQALIKTAQQNYYWSQCIDVAIDELAA